MSKRAFWDASSFVLDGSGLWSSILRDFAMVRERRFLEGLLWMVLDLIFGNAFGVDEDAFGCGSVGFGSLRLLR